MTVDRTGDAPGISVVTPSLNQAAYIQTCLDSVRKQRFGNVEHLVIDGGSRDGTREVVESFEHATFVDMPESSQSAALNWGFKNAKYPIICWLNSDDLLLDGAFELVDRSSRSLPPRWYMFSSFVEIDADSTVRTVRLVPGYIDHAVRNFATYVPTSGSFFSRTIVDDELLLDGDLHYLMDREFIIRVKSKGYRIVRSAQLLAGFRVHDQQKSGQGLNDEPRRLERTSINDQYGGVWFSGSRLFAHNKALESLFKLYVGASWKFGQIAGRLPVPVLDRAKRDAQSWIDTLERGSHSLGEVRAPER